LSKNGFGMKLFMKILKKSPLVRHGLAAKKNR
jgi:hypothetical protein